MPPTMRDPVVRFWENVDKNGPTPVFRPELGPCWVWTGILYRNGYGRHTVRREQRLAHRFSYALKHELAGNAELDHRCRNRACVRPSHLEPVTHRVNLLRGDTIAARNAAQTHCPQNHAYAGANLYVDPRGHRQCRACRREACRKSYARKKAAA